MPSKVRPSRCLAARTGTGSLEGAPSPRALRRHRQLETVAIGYATGCIPDAIIHVSKGKTVVNAKILVLVAAAAFVVIHPYQARATPEDDLAQCLVAHTNDADRTLLVKWIFAQFSLAPSVAPMARITSSQRTDLDKRTGTLITRLMATDCPSQMRFAYLANGTAAVQMAFQVLGQTAARGLMLDPGVQQGMRGFSKYVDQAKVDAALAKAPSSALPASTNH